MNETEWVEKHRPTEPDEIQGNTTNVEELMEWIEDFEPGDPPQLLHGEPGTGKTTTAYVAADHADLDLNQIDASTARTSDDVRRMTREIPAGDQLVLLDEVDSWHHAVRLGDLNDVLSDAPNPVIMTANSLYDVPTAIQKPATEREFKLSKASRRAYLKKVAKREGVPLDKDDLEALADRPDLRSAIKDLQLHAKHGLPVGDDAREWETSEFEVMDDMIKHGRAESGDVNPPWLLLWLDQNIRKEFRGLEAAVAYDTLSRADRHLGLGRGSNHRGWRFAGILTELTAHTRLSEPYTGWISWDFPDWVRGSRPGPEKDTPEAALYRELNGLTTGRDDRGNTVLRDPDPGVGMGCSFREFRGSVLPILRRMHKTRRHDLVARHGLSEQAAEALDVGKAERETVLGEHNIEAGEELDPVAGDAMEADW